MGAQIALADPAARDPVVVGEKAAGLAKAAAADLPVLPGRVLRVDASETAIEAGVEALERSGPPAAYLAAIDAVVHQDLERDIALIGGSVDGPVVVRSTTAMDDDGRWSGAFASYLAVDDPDVPAAVRGCWASAFSRDVLDRCRETGADVAALRIGVLVQPLVGFDVGGTARLLAHGSVGVTAAPGGPREVVGGGRTALDVVVGADGCLGELGDVHVSVETVEAAAALARLVAEAVGAGVIEWGAVRDEVFLLQVGPTQPAPATAGPTSDWTRLVMPADCERIARLVTTFGGPLGEQLVLPWALGVAELPEPEPIEGVEPEVALAEARALADELAADVWGVPPADARGRAASASHLLREGRVAEGLRQIGDLRPPDTSAARRLVGLVGGVGVTLTDAGELPSATLVWRLSDEELDRAIEGGRVSLRRGPDRWEPFVAEVVRSRGHGSMGTPVAPGVGAGRLHHLRELRAMGRPGARDVMVTRLPLPQLAPLLWHSAALVTTGGSTGAHLFEVARSLGVPAVLGVDVTAVGTAGSLVAVDGEAGLVSVLPSGPEETASSHRVTASGSRAMV
jgi:phosphohistidine swiveling domain-containing protein